MRVLPGKVVEHSLSIKGESDLSRGGEASYLRVMIVGDRGWGGSQTDQGFVNSTTDRTGLSRKVMLSIHWCNTRLWSGDLDKG